MTRELDAQVKVKEIDAALAATPRSAETLTDLGMRSLLALDFRDTDAMIGLPEVAPDLLAALRGAAERALRAAVELGSRDAAVALADFLAKHADDFDGSIAVLLAAGADLEAARRAYFAKSEEHAEAAYAAAKRATGDDPKGEAHVLLGWMTFTGYGREADATESYRLQAAAGERGNADGMFELYVLLSTGRGVAKDVDAAIVWCTRAAEAGSNRAMANLGGFHATGNGLPKDAEKSIYWYDRAAQAGNGRAAATLGVMYWLGQGADEDHDKARAYFKVADEHSFDWMSFAARCGIDPEEVAA